MSAVDELLEVGSVAELRVRGLVISDRIIRTQGAFALLF
jgi:hypothetical protein